MNTRYPVNIFIHQKKRIIIVYIIGLGLILSSLLYINHAAVKAETFTSRDTLIIIPLRYDTAFKFAPYRLTDWANTYNGRVLTESISTGMLESQTATGFAQLSAVTGAYFSAVHLPVIYGSLPAEGDEKSILLCEDMAFTLFGATDVVNLTVQYSGETYRIIGVIEAVTGGADTLGGFAWIPREELDKVGILYITPANYNPLSARLEAEELIYNLGNQPHDFSITDGNAYTGSIALRGKILLALCLPGFIFFTFNWLYKLYRSAQSRTAYTVAGIFTALVLAVTFLFIRYIATIDLWLPAHMGEGISGYSKLIFNTGLLAPRINLPALPAALWDLNIRANIAFCIGSLGILIVLITRFITGGMFDSAKEFYRDTNER